MENDRDSTMDAVANGENSGNGRNLVTMALGVTCLRFNTVGNVADLSAEACVGKPHRNM